MHFLLCDWHSARDCTKTGMCSSGKLFRSLEYAVVADFRFLSLLQQTPEPEEEEQEEEESAVELNMRNVLMKYERQCIERVFGYWTYQLCFGAQFRQFHDNDVYMLGRTPAVNDKTIEYADGDDCEAFKPDKRPRKVSVSFGCLKSSNNLVNFCLC